MSYPIRAISFDVGGTLIEPWPSVGHVYAQVAEEAGFPCPDPERVTRQFTDGWKQRQGFGYTRSDWSELVQLSFDGIIPPSAAAEIFPSIYERFTEARSWRVYEDVIPTLHQLRSRGLRLAVTSNWDERLEATLRSLGLMDYFEKVTASGPIDQHKPSAFVFQATCQALQLPPEQVLHVGDSRSEDLEGALAAGLHALHLIRTATAPKPHELSSLAGLLHFSTCRPDFSHASRPPCRLNTDLKPRRPSSAPATAPRDPA